MDKHTDELRWGMIKRPQNKLKAVDLFCGAGVGASGIVLAGYDIVWAVDVKDYAVNTYNSNIGCHAVVKDIRKVIPSDIPDHDLMIATPVCFKEGTLITTKRGLVPIDKIQVGDYVLTHNNRFMRVYDTLRREKKGIYKLKIQGSPETYVTEEHPYYIREMSRKWDNPNRTSKRIFSEPKWKAVNELRPGKDFVGFAVNNESINSKNLTKEQCWILGRYVADGWYRERQETNSYEVHISIGKGKLEYFKSKINSYNVGYYQRRTATEATIYNKELMKLAVEIGKGAENKTIPQYVLDLPIDYLEEFLNGYMSGDGSIDKQCDGFKANSVSKHVIYQMAQIVVKVFKVPVTIIHFVPEDKTIIEGREVNQNLQYIIQFKKETRKQNNAVFIDGMLWCPVKKLEYDKQYDDYVYNLEVEEDHSYCANNMVVHNCKSFSFAGNGEGIENKDFGDLSYHFYRLLKDKKPKAFLFENVDGMVSKKHRPFFDGFVKMIEEAGYVVTWKVVNCYEYGVPQHRKRVLMVGLRSDLNKKFEFPEIVPEEERTTIRYAIGDLPDPDIVMNSKKDVQFVNDEKSTLSNHSGYGIRNDEKPFIDKVPAGGNWRDLPEEDAKAFMGNAYYSGGGRTGFLRKVAFNKPAHTITSTMNGKNNSQIVDNQDKYYEGDFSPRYLSRNRQRQWDEASFTICSEARQLPLYPEPANYDIREMDKYDVPPPRRFTVRECLRLQTVPDWFAFDDSIDLKKQYERCSGIPSLVAYKLAIELEKYLL